MAQDIYETGQVILGGTRGSMPLASPACAKFGGATTSLLIDDGAGWRVVIDAGSGLRTLQPLLARSGEEQPVLLLMTHYHLDHLIGLPSFAPLYDPGWHVVVAAPPCGGVTAEDAISRFTSPPFWPVHFRASRKHVVLAPACEAPFTHGPFDVRWCPVHHANGCHAFRIDHRSSGASLVFATDLEWQRADAREREALLGLCRAPGPLDLLLMDGQYDDDRHAGWGHSRWQDTVEVARLSGAERLVVTHLDPDADDRALEERERHVQSAFPRACLGRQGQRIAWPRRP